MRDLSAELTALLDVTARGESPSWAQAEEAIGTRLPSDYKRLIDRVGAVVIDDWLCLFGPEPRNPGADIAVLVEERTRAWTQFRQAGIELPEKYFVPDRRLLAFASVEGTYFFWHARDDLAPQDWPVVVVDEDVETWYDLDMSATECLYQVLVGELRLKPFDDLFGGTEHRAVPLAG
jgi:hypothetical protein